MTKIVKCEDNNRVAMFKVFTVRSSKVHHQFLKNNCSIDFYLKIIVGSYQFSNRVKNNKKKPEFFKNNIISKGMKIDKEDFTVLILVIR